MVPKELIRIHLKSKRSNAAFAARPPSTTVSLVVPPQPIVEASATTMPHLPTENGPDVQSTASLLPVPQTVPLVVPPSNRADNLSSVCETTPRSLPGKRVFSLKPAYDD